MIASGLACRHSGVQYSRAADVTIVINDVSLDCVCVEGFTNDRGLCVSITGPLGQWFCISMYCPPKDGLEQYNAYLDEVVRHFHNTPYILDIHKRSIV